MHVAVQPTPRVLQGFFTCRTRLTHCMHIFQATRPGVGTRAATITEKEKEVEVDQGAEGGEGGEGGEGAEEEAPRAEGRKCFVFQSSIESTLLLNLV